mmetsp:Transcript_26395/g.58050  ORF Transcript_26395/g.58050 Transcript_26395/m.58050 type:complete len:243 (-) Transcript_26395:1222-1950(-)
MLHAVAEVQLEALDELEVFPQPALLRLDLLLQGTLLHLQLGDVKSKLLVLPHVVVQLSIHGLDLGHHGGNVVILGVDLSFELFDLIVQDELEFLQLLILLPQVIDTLLLICNGLVALFNLLLVRVLLFQQATNLLLCLPVLLLLFADSLLLFLHLALEVIEVLLVDPRLSPQSDLLVFLLRKLLLVHLLQLFNLPICILLELSQGLPMLVEGLLLLLDDAVASLPVGSLLLLKVLAHCINLR